MKLSMRTLSARIESQRHHQIPEPPPLYNLITTKLRATTSAISAQLIANFQI